MKLARDSIRFRILLPILAFVAIVTVALFLIVLAVSHNVSLKYFDFMLSRHSMELRKILDTAVTELIAARLLDNPVVAEAKQKVTAEELTAYWAGNDLDGVIMKSDGTVLYSSLESGQKGLVQPFLAREGTFHFEMGLKHINGQTIFFPAWGWKLATVNRPINWFFELQSREILFLLPTVLLGMAVLISSIFLILRRNFQRPVANILSDLDKGGEIRETGIAELDTIGRAINNSFLRLRTKTAHVGMLHEIAISLHDESRDKTINSILGKAGRLLGAGYCGLATFDKKMGIGNFFERDKTGGFAGGSFKDKGVPEQLLLSAAPLLINDAEKRPAFSDRAAAGLTAIKNIIINPIFSEGKHLGALFFANKESGFTGEDETLLAAVAADTATALVKAENLMQLQRFKQVIDSAFDLVVIADDQGCITYVNPACEHVTGYSPSELLGQKTDLLFGVQGGVLPEDLWSVLMTGNAWRGEFLNKKKNGEVYHTSAVVFPMRGDEKTSYASIQRDITRERGLHEHLLRAQKLDAIGTLAGGFAHDFNNILTAILGYADIMRDMVKEEDPLFRPVSVILTAAQQGANLTRQILTITRKEKTEVRPVDVNEVIHTSMDLLQRSIPKTIEIIPRLSADLPHVLADASQLQQVIVNLAINARDSMHSGGKLVLGTELISRESAGIGEEDRRFVKMFISDTGSGMDAETQRRIFDPFFTTKETGKGTGLGLYIVHSIVSSYGGRIDVDSEPGKGTTFNVYLQAAEKAASVAAEQAEDLRGSGTVLVIDDDPHVRELCRDLLVLLGYSVLSAADGSEGIKIFRELKDRISVVIIDMIMPKIGGGEVYEILKAIEPDVRVILSSGYSPEGISGIDALLDKGVRRFIQKPFSRLSLGRAVKEALQD